MKKQSQQGFTLIELLVVVTIIGILAGVIMITFSSLRKKAWDSRRKSDLSQIKTLVDVYITEHDAPPAQIGVKTLENSAIKNLITAENSKLLKDPKGGDYYYAASGDKYTLGAKLDVPGTSEKNCQTDLPAITNANYCIGN